MYLTALVAGIAVLYGVGAVGDTPIRDTAAVLADGPRWLGAGAAALVFMGLRSGSRGGPLALERAEVRHALLSPVDRTSALRGPAIRQLRFLAFAAMVVGAVAGLLAARRFEGAGAAWAACCALAAVVAVSLAWGVAACTAGLRVPPWAATLGAFGLLAWCAGDAASGGGWYSPASVAGGIALWPLRFDAVDLVDVALAAVAVLAGFRVLGGVSLERLERRSRLVGQLRFAATLQDVRTVVVLSRQLAQERPRNVPWFRPPLPARFFPVLVRDLRSLLRWPAARTIRLAILAVLSGLAARGAWEGTTPLIVPAGLGLFLAGLDAAEPLGQELDHPTRRDLVPRDAGWIHVRHLPAVFLVGFGVAAVAAVAAVLVDPVPGAWGMAALCALPAGLAGAAGAVVNLVMGMPAETTTGAQGAWSLAPPEAAGMRIVFRTAWPPAIAVLGCLPVVVARRALDAGNEPLAAATSLYGPILFLVALVAGWVRFREDIRRWWANQAELAQQQRDARSGASPAERQADENAEQKADKKEEAR